MKHPVASPIRPPHRPSPRYVYLDGRGSLGHYVEFTWKSPEAWEYGGWPKGRPVW